MSKTSFQTPEPNLANAPHVSAKTMLGKHDAIAKDQNIFLSPLN